MDLECIVGDEGEVEYVRADALIAIYNIAPSQAREIAAKYVNASGPLGRLARQIADRRDLDQQTSLLRDASWHAHG